MSSIFVKSDFGDTRQDFPSRRTHLEGPRSWSLAGLLARIGEHLRQQKNPTLLLEFPDRFVRFNSLREFEFALASRTEFPVSRIRDLMGMTPLGLERAAAEIRETERRFADILAYSVKEPALVGEFFRELKLNLFSQDHNWREIMEGLMRLSPAYDAYKRVALVKYMQYLRARQNIMRSVFMDMTRGDPGAKVHATRIGDGGEAADLGDTETSDVAGGNPAGSRRGTYASLPKGENIRFDLSAAREMEVVLAGNPMRLFVGRDCYMVDEGHSTYPLRPGKNLVGRHSGCDVVVDAACRSVSRHHLIVEPDGAGGVVLTDLSSHGTEVPAALMP